MGLHVSVGMIVGMKGEGRWLVTGRQDGYLFLEKIGVRNHESWKVLETRVFI